MNQEKIMKRKMYIAIVISVVLAIGLCVFIALYADERQKTQLAYKAQFAENMTQAYEEINVYLERKTDLKLHYNLVVADLGAARSFVFLINDVSDENKTAVNELFYCFAKYPDQMAQKLPQASEAIEDVTDNLDKGYDEIRKLVDSINKKGT